MGAEVIATFFGLASALSWGTSDFNGGVASKRSGLFGVVIVSQVIGLVLLIGLAVGFNEALPPTRSLLWGVAAGVVGNIGLLALYRGLATGQMGIVAPVSGLMSGVIPVLMGVLTDGLPSGLRMAGFALALAAVWLVSRTDETLDFRLADLQLPLLAGMAFGFFFVFIDLMSAEAVYYPLATARVSSIVFLLVVMVVLRSFDGVPARASLPFVLMSGVFDALGNVFFALATQSGRLDIAAVLASLYPAATVILAWLILKERMTASQWAGVVLALVAIVMISA